MTLLEVNSTYSTDDRCRELLERLRWPEGVTCPRCKDRRVSRIKEYSRYECVGCEYQFTVTRRHHISRLTSASAGLVCCGAPAL